MSDVEDKPASCPPDHLLEYRKHLVAAEQKSQEDFDKTVLSLSGGALGISFVFLKDVIGDDPVHNPGFLMAAWVAWGSSTLAVLTSYFMSHLSLRHAIGQVDKGTIYGQRPGGKYAQLTACLNAAGALLFLVGVLTITVFAGHNFSPKGVEDGRSKAATTTTATTKVPAAGPPANQDSERSVNRGVHPAGSAASSP